MDEKILSIPLGESLTIYPPRTKKSTYKITVTEPRYIIIHTEHIEFEAYRGQSLDYIVHFLEQGFSLKNGKKYKLPWPIKNKKHFKNLIWRANPGVFENNKAIKTTLIDIPKSDHLEIWMADNKFQGVSAWGGSKNSRC